jgi:hypothetical protein
MFFGTYQGSLRHFHYRAKLYRSFVMGILQHYWYWDFIPTNTTNKNVVFGGKCKTNKEKQQQTTNHWVTEINGYEQPIESMNAFFASRDVVEQEPNKN